MPRRLTFTRLSLQQQPLVFLALAFVSGLLAAARFSIAIRIWLALAASLWLAALALLLTRHSARVITASLLVGCFACGGTLWALGEAGVGEHRVRRLFERGDLSAAEPTEVWGTLAAAPELAPDRIYLSIRVERVATLMRERAASGTIQVVVPFVDDASRADYDALRLGFPSRAFSFFPV